jgi:sulfate permease, SulP family
MTSRAPAQVLFRWLGPWVAEVDRFTLRADLQAALLAAVLVLPQGIAFAALAGLPPAWGLYSAVVPTAIAAMAGSSRHVVTGPTNALSLALAASLATQAVAGTDEYMRLALIVTLMIGLIQVAVALLNLGVLTHFIAPSVLLGFTTGAAILIGWHTRTDLGLLAHPDWPALALGLATLVCAAWLRQRWPRGPGMMVALVGATLIAAPLVIWGHVPMHRIGNLPQPWPRWHVPDLAWADVQRLATISLALTLVALGQSMAIAKALAQRSGQVLDVNRECLGQGLANTVGSFFSCFASCGSFNRSVPHMEAGARTPLAALMAAGLLLALLALASPLLAWVPMAAVAGLLLLVAWTLIDLSAWKDLWRLDRREAGVAFGTLLATLMLPLQNAVLAGVAASLVVYLHRTAHPALRSMGFAGAPKPGVSRPFVVLEPGAPECPQLKMLRMEGSVWFGAEAHVADVLQALHATPQPARHLLVMAKSMNFIDAAGTSLWERERVRRLAMDGDLYFHRPRPGVIQMWQSSGFLARLGAEHVFHGKREAIASIMPRLDPQICAHCKARVFEECARQPGAEAAAQAEANAVNVVRAESPPGPPGSTAP